ncbi:MAG: hypothetical protein WCJ02_00610 [bacterium]
MQYITYTRVAVISLLMAGSVMAARQAKVKADTSAPVSTASANSEIKVPSEEEIKAFAMEYKESAESTTTETLYARFFAPRLTPEKQKKYIDAKTAPFQLTIDLYKLQVVDGQKKFVGRVDKGTASFAILDEEGKVVKGMSDDLIKLCSS